uniref:Transposase n=1 Tax=Globodera pallida TaxID=36090 RepID=A0A183BIG1_GLOPA
MFRFTTPSDWEIAQFTNAFGRDKTVIKNLPEIEGRQVTKIEVKITYDARRNTTPKPAEKYPSFQHKLTYPT